MAAADLAQWIAPAATMIAAMLTAANLGARITGSGFVIFTIGSIAWTIIGLSSDQIGLIATNAFLTLVNIVGAWRWLGRRAAYEEGGKSAALASEDSAAPSLFTASALVDLPVKDRDGQDIGRIVEALIECSTARLAYVVVASGTIEELRGIPHHQVELASDGARLAMTAAIFQSLPLLERGQWPATTRELRPALEACS